jgi:hypothetical protein
MIPGIPEITQHTAGITAVIGLSKPEATQPFATCQFGKVFLALFFIAILVDREHDQ